MTGSGLEWSWLVYAVVGGFLGGLGRAALRDVMAARARRRELRSTAQRDRLAALERRVGLGPGAAGVTRYLCPGCDQWVASEEDGAGSPRCPFCGALDEEEVERRARSIVDSLRRRPVSGAFLGPPPTSHPLEASTAPRPAPVIVNGWHRVDDPVEVKRRMRAGKVAPGVIDDLLKMARWQANTGKPLVFWFRPGLIEILGEGMDPPEHVPHHRLPAPDEDEDEE